MQPLKFSPLLKRIRWGGRRLGTLLGKPIGPESDYAESWEVVDHGEDQSVVCDGSLSGWTLKRLVTERTEELFGRHAPRDQFPLLIKFLDANDRLSVQVHPNDEQARMYDETENGKTEAWVILAAEPESKLYVGLKSGVDAAAVREALREETLEDLLHAIPVAAGDCVFVPAGTVHAIGEGILLAEIQQSSDLTFRLYDWGRLGTDGRPRELHIDDALACIDFARGPVDPVAPVDTEAAGVETLVTCDQFTIRRHTITAPVSIPRDDRFHVLMVIDGHAELRTDDTSIRMNFGETILLPAERGDVSVTPSDRCVLIDAFLP